MAKRPAKKATPKPVHYVIDVHADKAGRFTYKGTQAGTLFPKVGDTVSWVAYRGKTRVPFQVEFGVINPFGPGRRIIRSTSKPTAPLTVFDPPFYSGNRAFKYTVTLDNGWSDDPDIVPVPADGRNTRALAVNTILLSADNTGQLIVAPTNPTLPAGDVLWKWNGAPIDNFKLTFDAAHLPQGWPRGGASNDEQKMDLRLPAGGPCHYTIEALTLDLLPVTDMLTIV